jgi:hypothetical protein
MPSRSTVGALRDILHHIDLAVGFVGGLTLDAFRADLRTIML